jgi:ligand-binding SRPBCC domain-containing protein
MRQILSLVASLTICVACVPAHLSKYSRSESKAKGPVKEFAADPVVSAASGKSSSVQPVSPPPAATVYAVDSQTFRFMLSRDEVWEGLLDVLLKNYNLNIVDKESGIITTEWDSYFLNQNVYRNKISVRVRPAGRKGLDVVIHNNVERLDQAIGTATAGIWLPSEDSANEECCNQSQPASSTGTAEFEYSIAADGPEQDCSVAEFAMPERSVQFEQWVPLPVEKIFPFFSAATNLELITPSWLKFKVLGMSTPEIGQGTLIDYRLRLHGIPLKWRTLIESWAPNQSFVDLQVQGPFALWHHTHEFVPKDGGTLIVDKLRYRLPLGIVGDLCGSWFVKRDVDGIFAFRKKIIEERFGSRTARV